jgi:hypothetical protein
LTHLLPVSIRECFAAAIGIHLLQYAAPRFRLAFAPSHRSNFVGFRVVLSVGEVSKALKSLPVKTTDTTPPTKSTGRD